MLILKPCINGLATRQEGKLKPKKLHAKHDTKWREQIDNFPLQFFTNSSINVFLIIQMNGTKP